MKIDFVPEVVIYHDPCSDGFGAAYAVWRKYGNEPQYVPGVHDDSKLDLEYWLKLVLRKRVLICDFSFPRQQLIAMQAAASQLVLIDHHASAKDALGDLPFCHFDMSKSGAVLAWEAVHEEEAPDLLKYVQDKDLWRFELSMTKEVCICLESQPRAFNRWRLMEELLEDHETRHDVFEDGRVMLNYRGSIVDEICDFAEQWHLADVSVIAANTPWLRSEVGMELLEDSRMVSGCYWIKDGSMHWSLRSAGKLDVAKLASRFGGGGHPNASGFSVPLAEVDFAKRRIG